MYFCEKPFNVITSVSSIFALKPLESPVVEKEHFASYVEQFVEDTFNSNRGEHLDLKKFDFKCFYCFSMYNPLIPKYVTEKL